MNENQFCLSRNRYAIFTGNLIIHQIFFFFSVVTDKARIEEGDRALPVLPLAAPPLGKHSVAMEKYITCMSKSNYHPGREAWAGWGFWFFSIFLFLSQECISRLFNTA